MVIINHIVLRYFSDRLNAGELRERVEHARRITKEQKVVLDKINRFHRFFEHLDGVCNSVKEVSDLIFLRLIVGPDACQVHKYIELSCNALLLIYKVIYT